MALEKIQKIRSLKIQNAALSQSQSDSGPMLTSRSPVFRRALDHALKAAAKDFNVPRLGRFEAADQGTLFLDEIGDLSIPPRLKFLEHWKLGKFQRLEAMR